MEFAMLLWQEGANDLTRPVLDIPDAQALLHLSLARMKWRTSQRRCIFHCPRSHLRRSNLLREGLRQAAR